MVTFKWCLSFDVGIVVVAEVVIVCVVVDILALSMAILVTF